MSFPSLLPWPAQHRCSAELTRAPRWKPSPAFDWFASRTRCVTFVIKKKGAGSLLRTVRNGLPGLVWFAKWDVSKSESSKCRHTHTHMVEWHRAAPGMIHVHTKGKGEQKKKRTTTPPRLPSSCLCRLCWVGSCHVSSAPYTRIPQPPLPFSSPPLRPVHVVSTPTISDVQRRQLLTASHCHLTTLQPHTHTHILDQRATMMLLALS